MGKLKPVHKAVLQYLGSEIRHAQGTSDRFSHHQWTPSSTGHHKHRSWTWATPVAELLHMLYDPAWRQLSYPTCDANLSPTGTTNTRHRTHKAHCTAYTCGWEMWKHHIEILLWHTILYVLPLRKWPNQCSVALQSTNLTQGVLAWTMSVLTRDSSISGSCLMDLK